MPVDVTPYKVLSSDYLDAAYEKINAFIQNKTAYVSPDHKGIANGVASLDGTGKVPMTQIPTYPSASLTEKGIVQLNSSFTSSSETEASTPKAIKTIKDQLDTHSSVSAVSAHKAKNIGLEDTGDLFTSTDVEGALSELFTYANDGKTSIISALLFMGVTADASDTFPALANKITTISTGYGTGDVVPSSNYTMNPTLGGSFSIGGSTITAIATDAEGSLILGMESGKLLKRTPDGYVVWTNTDYTSPIRAIAVEPGLTIYTGDDAGYIRCFSTDGVIRVSRSLGYPITSICVDPALNINVSYGRYFRTYTNLIGTAIYNSTAQTTNIQKLVTRTNGDIFIGMYDGSLRRYDSAGSLIKTDTTNFTTPITSMAINARGDLYVGSTKIIKMSPLFSPEWTKDNGNVSDIAMGYKQQPIITNGNDKVTKMGSLGETVWEFTGSGNYIEVEEGRYGEVFARKSTSVDTINVEDVKITSL